MLLSLRKNGLTSLFEIPESGYQRVQKVFWTQGANVSKSLLHLPKPVLHRCNPLLRQCKRLFVPWVQKTFCTLSQPLSGISYSQPPLPGGLAYNIKHTMTLLSFSLLISEGFWLLLDFSIDRSIFSTFVRGSLRTRGNPRNPH